MDMPGRSAGTMNGGAGSDGVGIGDRFVRPLGGDSSFAALPRTVEHALCDIGDPIPAISGQYDRVVLVLVDAFGWRFFERHERHPLVRRLANDGVVVRLSSQFPSTTAAHLTTIHTGLPVGRTGLYEWFMYEPSLDRIIAPLLFSYAGDQARGTLLADHVQPDALFPFETLYQRLSAQGVRSFAFQDAAFTPSPYSSAMFKGAALRGEHSFPAMLVGASDAVRSVLPSYAFVYEGSVDAVGHQFGPSSAQFDAQADTVLTAIDEVLLPPLARLGGSTLLLITADHGQVDVDPATTINVNAVWPEILDHVRRGKDGRPLAPAGSVRDLFVHVNDDSGEAVCHVLGHRLQGRAEVHAVADLIDSGLFGTVTQRLRDRVGNVAILPFEGESIWWEDPRLVPSWLGSHGGLLADEIDTFVAALSF
jgi:hypothetical protein